MANAYFNHQEEKFIVNENGVIRDATEEEIFCYRLRLLPKTIQHLEVAAKMLKKYFIDFSVMDQASLMAAMINSSTETHVWFQQDSSWSEQADREEFSSGEFIHNMLERRVRNCIVQAARLDSRISSTGRIEGWSNAAKAVVIIAMLNSFARYNQAFYGDDISDIPESELAEAMGKMKQGQLEIPL